MPRAVVGPDIESDDTSIDLDTRQLRAFVAAADHGQFVDAAAELMITQQAISKRIARLEQVMREPLFTRVPQGVRLTDAGRRLLPHARHTLATARAAVMAVRHEPRPLRVDVWGYYLGPTRILAQLVHGSPDLELDTTARWDLGSAIGALMRDEIDVAFGRIEPPSSRLSAGLAHRLVLLEQVAVAVSDRHPLAGARAVPLADLRKSAIHWPVGDLSRDMADYLRRFSDEFGVDVDTRRRAVEPLSPLAAIIDDPTRIVAWGRDRPIAEADIRSIPLEPTPLYPWSMIWRTGDTQPVLAHLHRLLDDVIEDSGWLELDSQRHWLPDADRTETRPSNP